MKTVAAVIVTYNRCELLKECLESLDKQLYELNHIIIINNNSTDGTTDFLNSINDDRYIIYNLEENIGGAAGFSYGVNQAYLNTSDDAFWIMDDDTIPNKEALNTIVSAANRLEDNYGFLCSNVKWKDGLPTNIPDTTKLWSDQVENGLVQVERATFVSICVSRDDVKNYGLPIADLFIWGDDTEYTTRLSANKPSYMVGDSIVIHKAYKNLMEVTIVNDTKDRINRYYYMYRNVLLTHRLYHAKKDLLKQIMSDILVLFKIIRRADSLRVKRINTLLRGIFAGLTFNPEIKFPNSEED